MAATAASSSFLAVRGAAESAARRGSARRSASVVKAAAPAKREFPRAALVASPPSRHGSAAGKKRGDVGQPIPLAFDPLGIREAGGAPSTSGDEGLLPWGGSPEAAEKKARAGGADLPPPVSAERLDRWIRSSVTEIIKRIEEAPFLSFIFANDDGGADPCSTASLAPAVRLEREAAVAEDWPAVQRRWGRAAPDGVILVEELKGQEAAAGEHDPAEAPGGGGFGSAATRTWGVLIQGRGGGADCTACYILNTCRVRSALGCCTHFCLVRAQCYGDSAEAQLRNAWLAYGRRHCQQQ